MSDLPVFPKPPTVPAIIDNEDVSFILRSILRPETHDNVEILRFIAAYLECRDVKEASRIAGIARVRGDAFLRKRDVIMAIQKVTATAVLKHNLDPAAIVERVKEVADVDPLDLWDESGNFRREKMGEIPAATRRAIKKFKVKELFDFDQNGVKVLVGYLTEVEFWDKIKASELLGRETDLFKETKVVKHDATDNMKQILLGAEKRAEESAASYREVGPVIEVRKVLSGGQSDGHTEADYTSSGVGECDRNSGSVPDGSGSRQE